MIAFFKRYVLYRILLYICVDHQLYIHGRFNTSLVTWAFANFSLCCTFQFQLKCCALHCMIEIMKGYSNFSLCYTFMPGLSGMLSITSSQSRKDV